MNISNTQNDIKTPSFELLKETLLPSNGVSFNGVYRGVVTKCKTDSKKPLYIRVKIFGLTDELPSKAQPWASSSGAFAIPEPGTYVDVTFEGGDIHFPVWSNPSKAKGNKLYTKGQKQNKQQNQEIYNSQDGTTVSYDKSTGVYSIEHTSGAKCSIDADGKLTHESGPGGIAIPTFKILTEATICPYTKSPHFGGSPYMEVSDYIKV